MRNKTSNLIFYAAGIMICAATYISLNNNIEIMLLPQKTAIEYVFGYSFVFTENVGYEQTNGLFIIARNCSGIKLFISLFLIMIFGFLHKYTELKQKITALVKFYFSSLVLALIITIIRIAVSIPFCTWDRFYLIHNILSLAIYFISGLIIYFIMDRKLAAS